MTTTDTRTEGAQDEALRLAHALDGGKLIDDSTEWADTLHAAAAMLRSLHIEASEQARLLGISAEREMALRARVQELERERDNYKLLCDEWAEKTEWVQQTARPRELGLHRADALRERIERATTAEREVCAQMVAAYNTAMTDKIAAAIRARGAQGESND